MPASFPVGLQKEQDSMEMDSIRAAVELQRYDFALDQRSLKQTQSTRQLRMLFSEWETDRRRETVTMLGRAFAEQGIADNECAHNRHLLSKKAATTASHERSGRFAW